MSYDRTLRRIIDDTLRLCGDFRGSGRDGRKHAWTEVRDAVTACLLQVGSETGLTRGIRVIQLVAGQSIYDLPEDCLGVVSVTLHGLSSGVVVFPYALRDLDYMGVSTAAAGTPAAYYRETLASNQIAVVPVAGKTGSGFTVEGEGTALVSVADEDGDRLAYDEDVPLAAVGGDVSFYAAGDGGILSALWPADGNLVIVYHRVPDCPVSGSDEVDVRVPYPLVKAIKFGAALRLGGAQAQKNALFEYRWRRALNMGVSVSSSVSKVCEMRPL